MVDESTRKTLSDIPLLKTKAGPREKDLWVQRLKEEYQTLIKVNGIFIQQRCINIISAKSVLSVCSEQ